MKQFFISFIVLSFSLPTCGNSFAFSQTDMDMDSEDMRGSVSMVMPSGDLSSSPFSDESVSINANCDDQHAAPSSGMNCCNSDTSHSKIGIWEGSASEKTIKHIGTGLYPVPLIAEYTPLVYFSGHLSSGPPPNRQSYANLVGIIKRLD